MISLVDATVQLTDTYSLLTEYHTTILREMFNISDTDDIQAVKVLTMCLDWFWNEFHSISLKFRHAYSCDHMNLTHSKH